MQPTQEKKYLGTSPIAQLKLLLIGYNDNLLNAYENYYKMVGRGCTYGTSAISSRQICLFMFLQAHLQNDLDKPTFESLKKLSYSNRIESLEKSFTFIQNWLYKKELLRFDTTPEYREEKENMVI